MRAEGSEGACAVSGWEALLPKMAALLLLAAKQRDLKIWRLLHKWQTRSNLLMIAAPSYLLCVLP